MCFLFQCTVTSRSFTHIVSTEKMRKDMRDREDTRGTKYTYYNGCFLGTRLKSTRDQNPPAFKTHPIKIHTVKLENRLPVEGKG